MCASETESQWFPFRTTVQQGHAVQRTDTPVRPYKVSETSDKINCICRAWKVIIRLTYLLENAPTGAFAKAAPFWEPFFYRKSTEGRATHSLTT